jgi:hypothetical protein
MGIQIFIPLDMYAISRYPRQMPPTCEKWLPKFLGNDVTTTDEHLSNFWALFQLNPMSDDVEYLVMKLSSTTLTDVSRRWYESLPDKCII